MIQLYQGDCLEVMKQIPDRSVDCIITSPPYNLCLKIQNNKYVSRWESSYSNKGHLTNKYDTYKDDLPIEKYEEFQELFLKEALRVSDYVFYNIQMVTGNKIPLLHLMGKFAESIKDIIIWNKTNAEPAINKGVLNSQYEFIICLSNIRPKCRTFDNALFERGTETNVWDIKRERNKNIKAGFPIALVERIIRDFVPENATVLDPFMGSGTTGVACEHLNRNFIGIELDPNYFEIAKNRIENEPTQLTLTEQKDVK